MQIETHSRRLDDRPRNAVLAAKRRLAYIAAAGLLLATAACGADSDSVGEGSFVGPVNGTEALLALLAHGDQIVGYLSDGEQLSVWLSSGEIDGDDMTLENRDGVQQGTVRIGEDQVTGQVELDDTSYAFTLEPAEDQAGLYRGFADFGDGGTVEAGWIALADGTQVGAITTDGPGGLVVQTAEHLDLTKEFIRQISRGAPTVELAVDHLTPDPVEAIGL